MMDTTKFSLELSHHDNFLGVVISLLIETSNECRHICDLILIIFSLGGTCTPFLK